ncbi:MAG TPA: glycosyltransferase family 2 protein, partial [Robiginitalea sp.]|nr:glycosyltransferase family 2 protein [Robiginitalea sp.]
MPDHTPVSALIITYNERANIERCLASVAFASEIVVVDSYSTDGTYEYLLQQPQVKVVRHRFTNFTGQKNFALQHACHDWVLFLDADEQIPDGLRREILATLARPQPDIYAYWFYRQFMFNGKPLRFSGWQTDKNIRLFRKSKARYTEQRLVHERLEVAGRTACLTNRLIHFCYTGFDQYQSKMLLYGKLKALEA